jgi:hypothetical protein
VLKLASKTAPDPDQTPRLLDRYSSLFEVTPIASVFAVERFGHLLTPHRPLA